jgi:hypothetical protein
MIADLPKKLELQFWNIAIPAMSRNTKLQKLMRAIFEIVSDKELRVRSIFIIIGSVSGFLAGLILYRYVI